MDDRNSGNVDKGWINGKQLPNECNPCLTDLRQLAVVLSLVCVLNTRITVSVTCGAGSEKELHRREKVLN